MTTQRAVMTGTIANAVTVKNMFVADVVESGGDTYAILWGAYLHGIYDHLQSFVATTVDFTSFEIQDRVSGHWVTNGIEPYAFTAAGSGNQATNQVALTLIGKGLGLRKVGRKFFSGLEVEIINVNQIVGTALVTLGLMLVAYVTPFTSLGGGTLTPGILDKTDTFRPFVGGLASTFLGTMRRRKPGVGI